MTRKKPATAYTWAVVAIGFSLLVATAAVQAPGDLAKGAAGLGVNAAILLVLVFLSSVSPMQTRIGTVVSVGLAPLFGAVLVLPAWAVMVVAALGTIDERMPGVRIPWDRFLFNRGMFVLSYGLPALVLHSLPEETWPPLLPFIVALILALNVGQLSVAFSLTMGLGVLTSARRMLAGQWFTYIALPLIGVLIYVILNQNSFQQRLLVSYSMARCSCTARASKNRTGWTNGYATPSSCRAASSTNEMAKHTVIRNVWVSSAKGLHARCE
jgi:hypothetical protein